MNKKIRLGFVGSGFMGQLAHIANYATLPNCQLVALAEGRIETGKAVARRYGIQQAYSTHQEMLDQAELDAVGAIMSYHLYHAVVPDILDAGKPVMTEKPMCVGVDTAKKLVNLAAERGVIYQVGYMKRHDPASKLVKQTIQQWKESGECGNMTYIRITMPPGNWTYEIESPINLGDDVPQYAGEAREPMPLWLTPSMRSVYNGFINFYIHQVNLLRYLIDEDYEVTYVDPNQRIMVATSLSGVPCTLEMAPYGVQNRWDEFYRICFEGGKIDLSLPAPMARQRAGDVTIDRAAAAGGDPFPHTLTPSLPQKWAFLEQARHFVECVGEGKPTLSPASEGVKDLEVSEQYVRCLMASREN